MARHMAERGTSPVYYYDWKHAPPIPSGQYVERRLGAVHAAEIPYYFKNLEALNWNWEDEDNHLRDIVSGWLLNFVRTGNPNDNSLPKWPEFKPDDRCSMHISVKPVSGAPERGDRYKLIDQYIDITWLL